MRVSFWSAFSQPAMYEVDSVSVAASMPQCPQRNAAPAAVRDLQQALALHLVERTVQNDLALDGIERPVLGLTVGAVVRMDLLVAQADLEVSEGPALVLRVHSQRDRGARAQRGEQ